MSVAIIVQVHTVGLGKLSHLVDLGSPLNLPVGNSPYLHVPWEMVPLTRYMYSHVVEGAETPALCHTS